MTIKSLLMKFLVMQLEILDDSFTDATDIVDEQGVEPSRLLTAWIGLSGEVGEFNDIVKKCIFQGKEMDEDTVTNLKRNLEI